MQELWLPIEGYNTSYWVSSCGRVKSINKIIKPRISKGYQMVNLYKGGIQRSFSVHRLVAKAFLINSQNKPQVNHLDENKLNNSINNLEWCTAKENSNHGTRNKRISKSAINNNSRRKIMMADKATGKLVKVFGTVKEAKEFVGASKSNGNISYAAAGKIPSAFGYKWNFI